MDLSPEKLFMVALVALMVLGPQRLPQAARTAGRALAEVRRLSAGLQAEVGDAMATPRSLVTELRRGAGLDGGAGAAAGAPGSGPEARGRAGPGAEGEAGMAPAGAGRADGPAPDDAALN
jgi:mttA/Hcf106 family